MRPWSNSHGLAAGLALLVLANAVVLLGVAYNRSGASDGLLQLSERELRLPPTGWGVARDNSGIALRIDWRTGKPGWLDRGKLQSLGFDVSGTDTPAARQRYSKQLPREVLLVMELDGPAYRASLSAARAEAERSEAKLASDPQNRAYRASAASAQRMLDYEEQGASRLFIVDAGLDAAALRARYPDLGHYAIVRGTVAPGSWAAGSVSGVSIDEINVPARYRQVFTSMPRTYQYRALPPPQGRYRVTVAYGRRLEPWIVAVSPPSSAN
jgi:hypothetical protein